MSCYEYGCPGTVSCRGCPEDAPELSSLVCDECGERIPVGGVYWCFPTFTLCDDCMGDMSTRDLAERLGHRHWTMTREDAALYDED